MCQTFKTPNSFPEFCYRLVRASLYAFTFILCILGLSLITFSFWYIYEGKDYHLDNMIKLLVFVTSFLIGFVLFVLSMSGLTGVLRENLFLSKLYLIGMILLVSTEFICVFLIYSYKVQILQHASYLFQNFIRQYTEDDDIKSLVDTIQSDLKCCGISGPSDWDLNAYYNCTSVSTLACSVPASCCFSSNNEQKLNMFCGVGVRQDERKAYQMIHISGCKYAIYSFLDYKHKLAASILIGFLVPQLIGILLIISFILLLNYLIVIDSPEHDLHYILRFKPRKKANKEDSTTSSRIVFTSSSDESLNEIHSHKYYIG